MFAGAEHRQSLPTELVNTALSADAGGGADSVASPSEGAAAVGAVATTTRLFMCSVVHRAKLLANV